MQIESRSERSPLFLTRVATFVSLGIVLGYAKMAVPIPNVELVTATCFTAGFLLGPLGGILTGGLTEGLFAGFHPMGSSIGLLLISQMLGMMIAGFLGSVSAKLGGTPKSIRFTIAIVAAGVLSTLIFDILTNLAYPLMAGFSFSQTLVVLAAGITFSIIHLVSNFFVFLLIVTPLLPRLQKALTLR